jgi:hypothetical protein
MKSKLFCCPDPPAPAISRCLYFLLVWVAACALTYGPQAFAGSEAPSWMHALVNTQLPSYDEKTDAVLLYSETNVEVLSQDKIRTQVRQAYKILRPNGREHGTVFVNFNPERKVKSLHGWCIPAQGKDYEVKDKDAVEMSPNIAGGELISDVKFRVLRIPAPDPGNIVGYEYEVEERPFFLQDSWGFQQPDPVRESRYTLQLPPEWEYKASWLNHAEVRPTQVGNNQWQWVVTDVKWLRDEPEMPPVSGVRGQMFLSFFPPGGSAQNTMASWQSMGRWYSNLVGERIEASAQLKSEVATLTAGESGSLQKMQSLAQFIQHEIRYVAIELGIGGLQPHPAADVFSNRYGDCKDKATLMRSMLQEIGVESYFVVINDRRGSVTGDMPAHDGFNHVITAIRLPEGLSDSSLIAVKQHPKLGRILFFDPTDELTPFGQIRGELQANYGLLVTPDGGELTELPQQPPSMNSIERTAKLTLDPTGTLKGDVKEVRLGERASSERWALRTVTKDADRIKPIENLLAGSLTTFQITHASLINLQQTNQPFGFDYSFQAAGYGKNAGNLLLVRPRVLGVKGSGILETKEPRLFPIEFQEPTLDTDTFEITLPAGYVVDELPPPVDVDYGFASYHSKTVVNGNTLDYTRTFEVKELSVPVDKADQLRKFYRIIAGDERNTAVLKPSP